MKFNLSIALALLGATITVLADAAIDPALIAECGSADNVMPVPEGANTSEYRHCLNHPSGHKAGPSQHNTLEKRACWDGKMTGCTESKYI
jgi:hypothetical protein